MSPKAPTNVAASVVTPRAETLHAAHDDLNPTGELVLAMWDATPEGEPLSDWTSEQPLVSVPDRNPLGWLSIGLVALAAAALVGAIALMLNQGRSDREALATEAGLLGDAIASFDVTAPDPDFAAIDEPARALLTTAERLEVGDPQRAVAIDAATRLLEGERMLAEGLSYRTGFSVFVGRPDLPTVADQAQLSDISATFTRWVSDLEGVLQSAPSDRAFDEHQTMVEDFAVAIRSAQSAYLDALRGGDEALAADQITIVDQQVAQLDASLGAAITASQRAFSTSLDEIARMLIRLQSES